MVYVLKGQEESLMGRKDGETLGIIVIKPEGAAPREEEVNRITPVVKEAIKETGTVSGGETQAQIDRQMEKMMTEYKELFEGIGKAKIDPIHIYTKKGRTPVAQKQQLVARHYLEPLKKHLEEFLEGDVIEGPLGSEHSTG